MSDPKNQHIIPRCYLKHFVDSNTPVGHEPYVWIFEKKSKKGKKKAPKNILSETDMYTLTVPGGGKDYTLEKTLAQLEGEYSSVFEGKVSKKLSLNKYEHAVLCAFVAAMLQRTMSQKKNIENFYDQVIERIEIMEKAHGVPPKSSLKWREEKENAHRLSLIQMVPEIARILQKMNLAFLLTNKSNSFITSDTPCHLFNHRLQWQRFYPPAFGQKHVEIRMALSPEIAVCFSWANNLRGYLGVSPDSVHELNRFTFGQSDEYFIANSPKLKRGWFRRFPWDPVFIWRIIKNETGNKIRSFRNRIKYHV